MIDKIKEDIQNKELGIHSLKYDDYLFEFIINEDSLITDSLTIKMYKDNILINDIDSLFLPETTGLIKDLILFIEGALPPQIETIEEVFLNYKAEEEEQ